MKALSFEELEQRYDLISQPYGIYTHPNGKQFYFDKEYYDDIKKFNWTFIKRRGTQNVYIPCFTVIPKYQNYVPKIFQDKKVIYLPTFLLTLKDKENLSKIESKQWFIDYRNQNFNDYRMENMYLNLTSYRAMEANFKTVTTSGTRGVCWNKNSGKWIAYIMKNKKYIYLGIYTNLEDAIAARKKGEELYYAKP